MDMARRKPARRGERAERRAHVERALEAEHQRTELRGAAEVAMMKSAQHRWRS